MIINEKVLSSNFNAKLKVIKKSKRLKRKRNNLNHKSKTRIIGMKEIQINKFDFENQNTISKIDSIKTAYVYDKSDKENIFHTKAKKSIFTDRNIDQNNSKITKCYKEILHSMDNMNVQSANYSQISFSTCISSNVNLSTTLSALNNFNNQSNNNYSTYGGLNSHSKNEKYFLCVRRVRNGSRCDIKCDVNKPIQERQNEKYFKGKFKLQPHLLDQIYHQMLFDERETDMMFPFEEYTAIQTDINEKMRAVLIDWLVDVHKLFDLNPETIFLTVDIVDRYLSKKFILKERLQLLGVTSLWIACKYLDVCAIDMKYCVYVTDNTYTVEDIKKMEWEILTSLNFRISAPSILKLYDILAVNFCLSENIYYTGRYLLETFLLDKGINRFKKSLVACSAIYLAMKIRGEDFSYYNLVKCYTDEDEKILKKCAKQILFLIMSIEKIGLSGIMNKYSGEEYYDASKIEIYD
jgi:hypothetical protein